MQRNICHACLVQTRSNEVRKVGFYVLEKPSLYEKTKILKRFVKYFS